MSTTRSIGLSRAVRGNRLSLGLSTAVSTVLMFVLGKYVAHSFGPVGAGYQGGFNSAVTVAASLALFGATSSVPAYSAVFRTSRGAMVSRIVRMLLLTVPAAFALQVVLTVPVLHPPFDLSILLGACLVGLLAGFWTPLSRTLLSVYSTSDDVSLQQVIVSMGTVAVSIALLHTSGIRYLPLSLAAGMLTGQIAASIAIKIRHRRLAPWHGGGPSPAWSRSLLAFSVPYFVTAATGQLAFAAVPLIVLTISGPDVAGVFRAGLSLSLAAYGVLNTSIIFRLYPRLARASASRDASDVLLRSEALVVLRWASIAALALSVGAPIWLWLAYSSSFVTGSACLAFLSAAVPIRLLTNINTVALMSSGSRRGMLASELINGLLVVFASTAASTTGNESFIGGALLGSSLLGLLGSELITRRLVSVSAVNSAAQLRWHLMAACFVASLATATGITWAVVFGP